jgi:hypothetical protein
MGSYPQQNLATRGSTVGALWASNMSQLAGINVGGVMPAIRPIYAVPFHPAPESHRDLSNAGIAVP